MDGSSQLFFNFHTGRYEYQTGPRQDDSSSLQHGSAGRYAGGKQRQQLRRAVVRWLGENHHPNGMATGVPTRLSRYRADVAAFWSRPVRNRNAEGPGRVLVPATTAVYQCYVSRQQCWPQCAQAEKLLPELREMKSKLELLKDQIRQQEPELQDNNALFEEFAEWNYHKTSNPQFHHLQEQLRDMEQAVFTGTRFEQIRHADIVDELYLVVPENLVQPEELAEGWGLLWVNDHLEIQPIKTATPKECLPDNRMHLIQNIAAANTDNMLFANGVRKGSRGRVDFVKKPRGHRKSQHPRLGLNMDQGAGAL